MDKTFHLKGRNYHNGLFFKKGKTKLQKFKNEKEKQLYGSQRQGPTIQAESKYKDKNIPCKQ